MRGFGRRVLISLVLLAAVWYLPTGWLQYFWARTLAAGGDAMEYRYVTGAAAQYNGRLSHHGIIEQYDRNGKTVKVLNVMAHECTLIHLAALAVPFFVTRRTLRSLLKSLTITIIVVASINYVRLRLFFAPSPPEWSYLWHHDIPLYACYVMVMAFAVWYYVRHTIGDRCDRDAVVEAHVATTVLDRG